MNQIKNWSRPSIRALIIAGIASLLLSACGGGGGSSIPAATTTAVSGAAVAGAVSGTVIVNNAAGTQVATGTVTNGLFIVNIPNAALAGELEFIVTGTYTDEVSGSTVNLSVTNPLLLRTAAAHFTAGTAASAPITQDSSVIAGLVGNGMTLVNAQAAFNTAFGYTPDLSAVPFAPNGAIPAGAAQNDQDAAFRAGVFSQLTNDLGLTTATDMAELPAKLAADLADGTLDGLVNGNPVTFTGGANLQTLHQNKPLGNRISMALATFAGNSTANTSGVTPPSMGLPPIVSDAAGTIKQTTLSDGTVINVKVDVVPAVAPFQAGFKVSRTRHTVTLTDINGQPVDITTNPKVTGLMVMPWMYMNSGHAHPTEQLMINPAQAATGIYTIDIFYRMASGMNNMPMGQWELDVQLTDATAAAAGTKVHSFFFPNVMMAMGADVLRATGNNVADTWTNMIGTAPRAYAVWLRDIAANPAGGHDLTVFAATQNMANMVPGAMPAGAHPMMMTFPGVVAGSTLHGPLPQGSMTRPTLTVGAITLQASTDGGTTWQPLTAMGSGAYSITGLTGLTSAAAATIDYQLTVDIGAGANSLAPAAGFLQHSFTAP